MSFKTNQVPVAAIANAQISSAVGSTIQGYSSLLQQISLLTVNAASENYSIVVNSSGTALQLAPVVNSVFGRTGSVVAVAGDYTVSQVTGAAPLASPALTGTPTAPTATVGTNTTQIATTAFVLGQSFITGNQNITVSGDASGSGTTAITLTLASVGTAGTYGSASSVPVITTDVKGRVLSVTPTAIAINGSAVSGNISGNSANVTGVVAVANGGTGASTAAAALTNLGAVASSSVGVANGVASLDATGKVPTSQLPASVVGDLQYQGTWNASTNTPSLTSGTGTKGYMYKVSVAGTTTIDGNSSWIVGDLLMFDGTTWDKIDGSPTEVSSVFGRTGAVVAASGDYTVAQVTGAAPLASPTFTGIPSGPTATVGTNTTQLATTAFVLGQSFLTSNQNITVSGDASGSGTTAITLALASVGAAGTYGSASQVPVFVTDAKGRVTSVTNTNISISATAVSGVLAVANGGTGASTAASALTSLGAAPIASPAFTGSPTSTTPSTADNSTNIATTAFVKAQNYLTANQTITVSGDASGSGTTAIALTLASVGTAGTYGTSSSVPIFVTDAKGRVTSVTNTAISITSSNISGTVAIAQGGTGSTTAAAALTALGGVANAGGTPSIQTGVLSSRPTAGTAGRLYIATDTLTAYTDSGSTWNTIEPARTGDVTNSAGGTVLTLATVNSNVGTFGSATVVPTVTVNAKGLVTGVSTNTITPAGIGAVASSSVGAANGVASLDATGKVPTSQLPASVVGDLQYQGTWNASTNSPSLTSGTGTKGYMYKVSVAGTTTIDGNSSWIVGDLLMFDGTTWDKIDGSPTEVSSVFGRTGAVVAASGDYTVAQITGAAPLASPTFTGTPTAPNPTAGNNSTQIATTAWVTANFVSATKLLVNVISTTTATLTNTEEVVVCTNTAARNMTLPSGASCGVGYNFVIKDGSGTASTANVTVTANGTDTIDGSATAVIQYNYESITIVWNGSSWNII